jgi:hypothetical protein
MRKKEYQKPTMKAVQLRQRRHILTGSGPKTLRGHEQSGEETEDTWYDLE